MQEACVSGGLYPRTTGGGGSTRASGVSCRSLKARGNSQVVEADCPAWVVGGRFAGGYPRAVCGRYTLTAAPGRVAEHFQLASPAGLRPRWNVAPGQSVPAVLRGAAGERVLEELHWGLVPPWAKAPDVGARAINARVESAAERPAFREAFRLRRCLVPADGFYEWRSRATGAEPHHVALPERGLFAFAGLHETWRRGDRELRSLAILTGQDERVRRRDTQDAYERALAGHNEPGPVDRLDRYELAGLGKRFKLARPQHDRDLLFSPCRLIARRPRD